MPEWWGGWAGTIYYNIFCVCICLKKLQNMLSVANSWNRICWSDTQRSSTGKLDYSCLNDDQKFLPHVISEHLIQMSQSGMFTRFAHCLCRFAFTVPNGLVFLYVWRPRNIPINIDGTLYWWHIILIIDNGILMEHDSTKINGQQNSYS